ncbi:MAG: 6-carboxytetrahydropterin synthase QueD [Deltaproteobacteria bacterium]|nr:6-carboxytetrahydropterin synthase QueD [Deltaproteobacteria bacterium]
MSTTIVKSISFEAAHWLPNTPMIHKCHKMHGHSYICEIHVTGEIQKDHGWICDFAEISGAFAPLHVMLDHQILNEIAGLENPTAENIAKWVWEKLSCKINGLSTIVIHETPTSRCIYTGP